ncbi:exopolysaccharide biosynthesis polyprenyl glycosylphosphotransferase [Sphingomonas endophytica]|uniref:Sugar transferase n=1 Tax=Sphingomonas endophytica TaxID=869719 RepID=A0A147I3H9_9SPHN|nr:exopolysaccharide biosynthesis polyprenyl glycosylphosphotransferase [Sphingomonas endophytica]KTT72474.1 sugar transferase [Sphingomonas endophytica]
MATASRTIQGRRFTSNVIPTLVFLTDLLCLVVSAPVAVIGYAVAVGSVVVPGVHTAACFIAGIAFFLIRQSRGVYTQSFVVLQSGDTAVGFDYLMSALLSSAIVWQFGLLDHFSRGLTLAYVVSAIGLLIVSRFVLRAKLRRLAESGRIRQRVVLYGADKDTVERTCRMLDLQALPQLLLVGVADDYTRPSVADTVGDLPFIGGFPELLGMARAGEIDQVLIALSDMTRERIDLIIEKLSEVAIDISLIPREAIALAPDYRVNFVGSIPVLTLWQRQMRDGNTIVKDVEDYLVAATALILLSPLLLVTALAIKLTSRGPIIFKQPRFGFNNHEILVWKFRSMYVDRQDVSGAARTTRGDPRVTPVGRLIRKLSIDELPQLWNVLRGEMSIVGPRPHATHMKVGDHYYFDAVKGYAGRHRVKPGITGLAQVRGLRGEIQTIERAKRRVELDRYYIDHWSLTLDLRIMVETVVNLLFDKNAY